MSTNNEHSFYTSDDEIDLRAVLRLLFQNYKLILGVAFSFAVLGALVSFFVLSPVYESTAVIMPNRDQNMSGRLQSFFGNSSLSQFLNFGGPNQEITQYYELLRSQNLVSRVVEEHNLLEKFHIEIDQDDPLGKEKAHHWLVGKLQDKVEITMEGNILRLKYRHIDPRLAYEVVNAYLKKLGVLVQTSITTSAQSTQAFIQKRLEEAEEQLKAAEADYLILQNTKGVVELPSQLGLTLSTASSLRNQLIEKEMEIELYKNILKDSSEIQRLESEKRQIQTQLDRLIQGSQKNDKKNMEVFTPLGQGASLSFQFANAERNYLMYVKLTELLQQQLELARIETKKHEPMFQIIDPPILPVLPVGPNKKLITALSFLLGLFAMSFIVLIAGSNNNLPKRIYQIVKVDVRKKSVSAGDDETDAIDLEPLKRPSKS